MRTLLLLTAFVGSAAWGQATTPTPTGAPATPPADDSPFAKGRVVVRGGANLDLNQSINLGGVNSSGARITAGLHGGIGYFIIPNLSLDVDVHALAYLTPTPGLSLVQVTPGARYYAGNLQFRVGVPIPLIPTFGLGVLGGVAWSQPLAGRARMVFGVDYTYYLTETYRQAAPLGRVDLHGGIQTSF